MTQEISLPNLGEKPEESALFPKPWMESTTKIISPILWLGKLTRMQAFIIGFAAWFLPSILLIYAHWNEPDRILGAVGLTWLAAALYAAFLHRINFDIKEGS
jgi:hypothetical protein